MTALDDRDDHGGPDGLADTTEMVPLRRNRDFLLLWTGNWLQFFSSRMSGVCYPLLALYLSGGSAKAAGLATAAAVLPYALVQLPAGVLVDRWDRRRVMQLCAIGRALVLSVVAALVALDFLTIGALLALIAADVSFAVVASLAERAAVRAVVPGSQLPSAVSQNEARGRVAGLLGGPAGTLLFTWFRSSPFLAAGFGALVAAVNVRFIRTDCRPPATPERRNVLQDLAAGVAWVRRQPLLRAALPLVAVATGLLQVVTLALMVMLVKEQGHDESMVGLLLAISGCGGVLGALTARWWMRVLPFPALLIGGFAVWAGLIAGMSGVSGPVALGVLFAVMNLIGAVFGVATAVYQMTATPQGMQGRVAALAGLVTAIAATAGSSASGWLIDRLDGPRTMLLIAGAMALLALTAVLTPAVRRARLTSEMSAPAKPVKSGAA